MLLRGYAAGIFPMSDARDADDIFWVEPRERAILPLDAFHCSRSLAKRLRSGRFRLTCDTAFHDVILACADRDETWINDSIERAVMGLYASGHAHSIECWEKDRLVGGLYGVKLGRAFFGESMFSRSTDASKVALAWLVARLRVGHYTLLDCQFMTDHLASLGAKTVSRETYAGLLGASLSSAVGGAGLSEGSVASGSAASGEAALPPPDFGALDRLLDAAGASGAAGPAGHFISQLLGQTS
ncbi:leucyl/phenylalanyl-tRNA--protein transferase [Sphingomonas jaspsi]|uniref:leucyl/phenylalanyl-tRNA--protein transferase n=1 Tax=Sphingomonas jaspsi TaxID=392409 RepID=UPI000568A1AD|nr:leucyl/phenylalanyl-tRNA--protein transferase [Sphingomonas jaspsi]